MINDLNYKAYQKKDETPSLEGKKKMTSKPQHLYL